MWRTIWMEVPGPGADAGLSAAGWYFRPECSPPCEVAVVEHSNPQGLFTQVRRFGQCPSGVRGPYSAARVYQIRKAAFASAESGLGFQPLRTGRFEEPRLAWCWSILATHRQPNRMARLFRTLFRCSELYCDRTLSRQQTYFENASGLLHIKLIVRTDPGFHVDPVMRMGLFNSGNRPHSVVRVKSSSVATIRARQFGWSTNGAHQLPSSPGAIQQYVHSRLVGVRQAA
jgi:hypothetical protein